MMHDRQTPAQGPPSPPTESPALKPLWVVRLQKRGGVTLYLFRSAGDQGWGAISNPSWANRMERDEAERVAAKEGPRWTRYRFSVEVVLFSSVIN